MAPIALCAIVWEVKRADRLVAVSLSLWSMYATALGLDPPGFAAILDRFDDERIASMQAMAELGSGPIPAVLDTSCVRTGLHSQLVSGRPPACIAAVRSGATRMFMAQETLFETWELLPRFADQLDVPTATLHRHFAEEWLPWVSIVSLPDDVRELDGRAVEVRGLDPDDYPAAALAALLSPCILLTHNHKHFRPLGITVYGEGVDAVIATLDLRAGETRIQANVMMPVMPVLVLRAGTKWAADRIGPAAWLVLGLLLRGGWELYRCQPSERKERLKGVAATTGQFLLEDCGSAMACVHKAQVQLSACASCHRFRNAQSRWCCDAAARDVRRLDVCTATLRRSDFRGSARSPRAALLPARPQGHDVP